MKMAMRNAANRGIFQQAHPTLLFTPKSPLFRKPPPPHLGVGVNGLLFPRHSKPGFGYPIRGGQVQGIVTSSNKEKKQNDDPPNWKIKMLYDGECPLCMREVNMLRERNKQFQAIAFVDISSDDYSPADNQDLDYPAAMGRIHAILADGTVVTDVEAFRKLYEAVNLGWVYAVTKYEPIATIANSVYGVWAKYRMQITGRPPLEEVIEAKLKKKAETCGNKDACKM